MPNVSLITQKDANALHDYHHRNADHLRPWEPLRDPNYHSLAAWEARAADLEASIQMGTAYHFAIKDNDQIIGLCNFTGVQHGAFQACYLGYSVDLGHQGRGVMLAGLSHAIDHMFTTVGLNRIMANYMPANERSGKLLARLGFEHEGHARRYLKIAGVWEDHILTSLINPAMRDERPE